MGDDFPVLIKYDIIVENNQARRFDHLLFVFPLPLYLIFMEFKLPEKPEQQKNQNSRHHHAEKNKKVKRRLFADMSQHPQYGIELKQDDGTDPQNKQTGKDRHLLNYGKQKSEAGNEILHESHGTGQPAAV